MENAYGTCSALPLNRYQFHENFNLLAIKTIRSKQLPIFTNILAGSMF
jgi:hypothetical protein